MLLKHVSCTDICLFSQSFVKKIFLEYMIAISLRRKSINLMQKKTIVIKLGFSYTDFIEVLSTSINPKNTAL